MGALSLTLASVNYKVTLIRNVLRLDDDEPEPNHQANPFEALPGAGQPRNLLEELTQRLARLEREASDQHFERGGQPAPERPVAQAVPERGKSEVLQLRQELEALRAQTTSGLKQVERALRHKAESPKVAEAEARIIDLINA